MRKAIVKRKTKETDISVKLNIDGSGKAKINTGIGILNHMLELFAFHGLFDLEIQAKGDLKVDIHHTNEDIGIVLGEAFKKALGEKAIAIIVDLDTPKTDNLVSICKDLGFNTYILKRSTAYQNELAAYHLHKQEDIKNLLH